MNVTVVTPLYNAEAYIAATIQSVIAQTHSDVEHVVVDDGSTDRSAAIVTALEAVHPQIRLIQQENRGVAAARNHGARVTRSDSTYLLFLDADDLLVPEALATLTAYLDAHPDAAVVFCATAKIDSDGRPLGDTARHTDSARSALRLAPLPVWRPTSARQRGLHAPHRPSVRLPQIYSLVRPRPALSVRRNAGLRRDLRAAVGGQRPLCSPCAARRGALPARAPGALPAARPPLHKRQGQEPEAGAQISAEVVPTGCVRPR